MRTDGVMLDIYDDPKASVLLDALQGTDMPAKLASSHLLDRGELQQLPDRLFGLVALNNGNMLRKYAMHDEPHLSTSIIYFMELGSALPAETQVKVASNLVNACGWYHVDPPDALVKVALGAGGLIGGALTVGMGAMELMSKAKESGERKRQEMGSFRRAQTAGMAPPKLAAGSVLELTAGEDSDLQHGKDVPSHVAKVLKARDNVAVVGAKLDRQVTPDTQQDAPFAKQSDLNGTEVMPYGVTSKPIRPGMKKVTLPAKTAAARAAMARIEVGHELAGDISHLAAPSLPQDKTAGVHVYALPHKKAYPLDTVEDVKIAQGYFDENYTLFDLADRRVFAQSVSLRGEAMGVKVAGALCKYAGDGYGDFIASELLARERSFIGTGNDAVYSALREKLSEISPTVMTSLLKQADEATGVDRAYGRPGVGLLDYYAAVYSKTAADGDDPKVEEKDSYSWVGGSDYVSGFQLMALAENSGGHELDHLFANNFGAKFRADPIKTFKALPTAQKVVVSRIASDNSGAVTQN